MPNRLSIHSCDNSEKNVYNIFDFLKKSFLNEFCLVFEKLSYSHQAACAIAKQ
jgi:hypothetical protein